MTSGIAVVIPARDEGAALGDSLGSLAGQTLRPDRIVVVVNNSTDDTSLTVMAVLVVLGGLGIGVIACRRRRHDRSQAR